MFDSMGKAKRPTPRFPVRDEFLNLDFPMMQLVHKFSLHPFMRRLSREQFEPMAQFAIHIRDNFSWSPHTLAEGKPKAMRQSLRSYFWHTETLSDIIVRYKDLASAHVESLAPAFPGCPSLCERKPSILRSKITPAFLRSLLPANPMDASLNLDAYPGTRSVEDYVRIPEAIIARLELYWLYRRELVEYAHLPDGVLKYVTEVLRPYAETIVRCIPATMFRAIDLPSRREGEIGIYVADYVCQAAICYDMSMAQAEISKAPRAAIDMRCTHALWMAIQLDSRCGSPSEGYAPQGRVFFLSRVRLAIHLIAEGGTPGATLDVPLPLEILALLHFLAWDAREIAVLAKSEIYTYMQCEMLLMDEEVNEASRLIEALERAREYQAMDYWLGPSGQRSV
ncbi:hypothetical protein B0H17DRAFT_1220176 [Mycena rosella]|uniref:Uncharacterized protein n=1 Tax=Mycena rosella TaxID=1033263 RepID=A0AAD7BCH8_MYCRO|nr:hypothetical protein B0H17DRAFT_1220176 [Mycena rosella]